MTKEISEGDYWIVGDSVVLVIEQDIMMKEHWFATNRVCIGGALIENNEMHEDDFKQKISLFEAKKIAMANLEKRLDRFFGLL